MEMWIWQEIISPHVSGLANELVTRGVSVTFVAGKPLSDERKAIGWEVNVSDAVRVLLGENAAVVGEFVAGQGPDVVNVVSGFRGGRLSRLARHALQKRGRRYWVMAEGVDDSSWHGMMKRFLYRALLAQQIENIAGILAIGYKAKEWYRQRGVPDAKIFDFAYFPQACAGEAATRRGGGTPFRFMFVGQCIARKRVSLLIRALHAIDEDFELWIAGDGPEKETLQPLAHNLLGQRVKWFGVLPISRVPSVMAEADCLVLPSRWDGWGAVASEAMIVGTPVVCSSACGVAEAVLASGEGGVFEAENQAALTDALICQLQKGRVDDTRRSRLADWAAHAISPSAGARYLLELVAADGVCRPLPPWVLNSRASQT